MTTVLKTFSLKSYNVSSYPQTFLLTFFQVIFYWFLSCAMLFFGSQTFQIMLTPVLCTGLLPLGAYYSLICVETSRLFQCCFCLITAHSTVNLPTLLLRKHGLLYACSHPGTIIVWAGISFSLAQLHTVVAGGSYYCFQHTPAINCCTCSKLSSFEEMIAKVSV